jgi:hypothetical protein
VPQPLADGGHEQKNTIISGLSGCRLRTKTRGKSASFGFRRDAKRSSLHKRSNGVGFRDAQASAVRAA